MNLIEETVLVTGATGFVGEAVVFGLLQEGKRVVAAVRNIPLQKQLQPVMSSVSWVEKIEINNETEWNNVFGKTKVVVHCAALTVLSGGAADSLVSFRDVNVLGTLRLARQAAAAGIHRFVFLSSIKVNGESSPVGRPFTEVSTLAPQNAYGQSKVDAEKGLMDISRETGMDVVIVRSPLVIGSGAKGNIASMLRMVQLGVPLPLGAINNRRSLVSLSNLVSLLLLCADPKISPKAANQIFVVADGEDISTTNLLHKIAQAAECPNRLLPIPVSLLRAVFNLFGQRAISDRLIGNLQVDTTKVRTMLDWSPVVTLDEELNKIFNAIRLKSRRIL